MIGTGLNLAGVALGGLAGLIWRRQLPRSTQNFLRMVMGVFTVWIGLRMAVSGLHWPPRQYLIQLLLAVLALMLGRLLGRGLHLQKGLNRLGRVAAAKLAPPAAGEQPRPGDGFQAATILLCAAPLTVLGSIPDGLTQDFQPLLLKGVMDGMIMMALVPTHGWTVLLAALPMAAVQVTLTLLARTCEPLFRAYSLFDSVHVVCGLLIFCVSLIIFAIRKIEVGDYLPALAIAPVLAWLCR